jgi:hypothetical protein
MFTALSTFLHMNPVDTWRDETLYLVKMNKLNLFLTLKSMK